MSDKKQLNENDIEKLAMEIFNWLVDNEMWSDVRIYFNDKALDTYNPETNEYYYGERKYYIHQDIDPKTYFEYVNSNHILSMSFEGPLNHLLNYGVGGWDKKEEFDKIFNKYGVYYEHGNAWNLSCYYN